MTRVITVGKAGYINHHHVYGQCKNVPPPSDLHLKKLFNIYEGDRTELSNLDLKLGETRLMSAQVKWTSKESESKISVNLTMTNIQVSRKKQ